MEVICFTDDAVYIRLPEELQRSILGGCDCDHCKKNPTLAKWDTLVVPRDPKVGRDTYTVHMPPDAVSSFVEYMRNTHHLAQRI